MPLSVGDKLGPYEILAPIGAGGMGEVYRARDARLNREVAIKVSQERFSDRFEREARAVAALNHPNISTLYDVGPNYLVMELIDGDSPKGPLPLDEAVRIARQIASALDAAHSKGIVHRDLKPANIKVKPDGTVKVLDFGLAKTADVPTGDPENSPTMTVSPTHAGMIMGTASYMSPEQARGKSVDKRSDIWAFGVVLYELLTGERPFRGEDLTEILASVVKDTPDLSKAPAKTQRLLKSCLTKDPEKRLRDIGDVGLLLEESAVGPTSGRVWPFVAGALAAAAVLGIIGWLRLGTAKEPPAVALSIVPPPGVTLGLLSIPAELSPDGTSIVYAADDFRMYLRRLDSLESRVAPGGSVASPAFWSPDSTAVVRHSGTQQGFIKVRIPDGAPEFFGKSSAVYRGGTWSEAGTILITGVPSCLEVIPASGGDGKAVEMPAPLKDGRCYFPNFLPGSEDFLFLFAPLSNSDEAAVYLATLRDGKVVEPVALLKNQTGARYTPAGGGRILFVRSDNLYSQNLNRQARKLEGEPELLAQGVASSPAMTMYTPSFSVARNGTIAWRQGKAEASQVTEFDRSGRQVQISGPAGQYPNLSLSADDRQLLVSSFESGWMVEVGQPGRLALPKGVRWIGWFAGGSKLLGTRALSLVEVSNSGSGEPREFTRPGIEFQGQPRISLDGKLLVGDTNRGPVSVQLDGTPEEMSPKPISVSGDRVRAPSLSPDTHWVVYDPGDNGLYVRPFPGAGSRRQIATLGEAFSFPYWRTDGKEILYVNGGDLMSVAVEWNGTLAFGAPRKLFSGLRLPAGRTTGSRSLATSRDGSRIFWLQSIEQPESNVIHVKIGAVR